MQIMLKLLQKIQNNYVLIRFCSRDVRVRFAPSPTGLLHLGGLRTALYNYLFAKSRNGQFILRIEDTDRTRVMNEAVESIETDLKWFGIEFDEGPSQNGQYGPYIQSQRLHIYDQYANQLLDRKLAYYCFCTESRLNLIRKEALRLRQVPKYDNNCRALSESEINAKLANKKPYCIRFKLTDDIQTFKDIIYGPIRYNVQQNEGDPIIIKSDGYPTYHFANVIDDYLMQISHVIRGVEWQMSTIKHLQLYRALDLQSPPAFAHLPLLMNADGKKLSKRQNDIDVRHFRERDYFPLALLNLVILCGGGFDQNILQNPQIFDLNRLTKMFTLEKVGTNSTQLTIDRLAEFNQLELKRQLDDPKLRENLLDNLQKKILQNFLKNDENRTEIILSKQYLLNILKWSKTRISNLNDLFGENYSFLWFMSKQKTAIVQENSELISVFAIEFNDFNRIDDKQCLKKFLRDFSLKHAVDFAKFMGILRAILTGLQKGPSVIETIQILGKTNVLSRLQIENSDGTKLCKI